MKNEDGDLLLFADGMKAYHSLGLVSISHRDFLGILQHRHQTVAANHSGRWAPESPHNYWAAPACAASLSFVVESQNLSKNINNPPSNGECYAKLPPQVVSAQPLLR